MNEELRKLLQEISDPSSRDAAVELFNNLTKGSQEGKKINAALLAVKRTFVDVNEQAREFTDSFAASLQEITRSNIAIGQARKATRGLLSISQKLQDNNTGISKQSLKQLATLKEKAKVEKQRLEDSARAVINELNLSESFGNNITSAADYLQAYGDISDEQASILRQFDEGFPNIDSFIETLRLAEESQAQLNRMTGLTGAALNNLNKIGVRALGGLGINLGALERDLQEAEVAAINAAEKVRQAADETVELADEQKARVDALVAALPGIGKALGTALIDPLTIGIVSATQLKSAFNEINQAQTEFRRLTGRTGDTFEQVTSNAANAVETLQIGSELTRRIGMNAQEVFGPETLLQITEAKNLLGLSAEQAGRIAIATRVSGENMSSFRIGIEAGVKSSNRLFKSGISTNLALQDALSASDGIALSLGMSGERLGKAASAARALGVELSDVDAIASSLLNFESSIENELQAQLLTGRHLNLVRARELALNNDLAGVAKEVTQNIVTGTEFANMNRIAQEGIASAIGVSRDQLARMIIQQDLNNSLTEEQRANMMGLTLEQYENQQAAEALKRSFQGIAQSITGLVEPTISFLAENEKILKTLLLTAAAFKTIQLTLKTVSVIEGTLIALRTKNAAIQATQVGLQRRLNILKANETAQEAAQTVFAAVQGSKVPFVGLGVGLAALAAGALAYKQFNNANDGLIDPKGGLIVSEPTGTFGVQLNPKDQLIAGTELNKTSGLSQTNNNDGMMRKLDELISAVKTGGNVYLDGNKVGESLVLSSVKSS